MRELGQLKLFFEEVVYITKKVGFRHGKTVWPNGDNYGAQLGDGEATWTTFPALYYAPCCFLSPTVPMAQYHTLSRDDHELHDSSDPWNNSDGVLDTVSARPRRAVFSHFNQLKVPCINLFFFLRCLQYHDEQYTPIHPPENKFPTRAMSQRIAQQKTRKRRLIWIGVGALIIVAAAVAVGVTLALTRKKSSGSTSPNGGSGGSGGSGSSSSTSGKTGSRVTLDDGSTFVYTNDFGGDWVFDPKLPFAAGGQAQSWTPRVGKDDWVWGQDVVKGVNLG